MANGIGAIAAVARVIGRFIRVAALGLYRLARLTWILILRGGRAFGASSGETKTTTLTALGFGLAGVALSPFIGITVFDSTVSSALVLGLFGLLFGTTLGYSGIKKVRTGRGGAKPADGDESPAA